MSKFSSENEQFIDSLLATGTYSSRDEALEAGIELLRKHDVLVKRIRESRRQLDRGEFTDYDEESLEKRFEELKSIAGEKE